MRPLKEWVRSPTLGVIAITPAHMIHQFSSVWSYIPCNQGKISQGQPSGTHSEGISKPRLGFLNPITSWLQSQPFPPCEGAKLPLSGPRFHLTPLTLMSPTQDHSQMLKSQPLEPD